jgi:hypothetical protein
MKNPILPALIGLVNTGLSIIRDKKPIDRTNASEKFIDQIPEKGVSLSGTRVMGYGIGGAIIALALTQIETQGANTYNLIMLGTGALVTVSTQFIVYLKEKPQNQNPQ